MTQPHHSVVYGPVRTRRLGNSLGVNPVPSTRDGCPPDCVLCQSGLPEGVPILSRANQMPSAGVVVTTAARKIIELSKAGEKLDSIVLGGDGDPVRHPALLEITENLRDLRNKWFPKADLCLISDSEFPDEVNTHALSIFDKPILRFEWGTAKTYGSMTSRPATGLKRVIERLAGVDRLIVQATFVQGTPDNSKEPEVRAWIKMLEELRPREVHLLTIEGARRGAKVRPVPASKLEQIAAQVTEKIGVPATVFVQEAQPV